MNSALHPTNIVGCPFEIFIGICGFWVVAIFIISQENIIGIIMMVVMSFVTAWLWGMFGWMVLKVGIVLILVGGLVFLIWFKDIYWEEIRNSILVAAFGIGGPILFYQFVVKDEKKEAFLSFWLKVLLWIGIGIASLAAIWLFVYLANKFAKIYLERRKRKREEEEERRRREEEEQWRLQEEERLRIENYDINDPERVRRNPIPTRKELGLDK